MNDLITVQHNGYELSQIEHNYHYMIFDDKGRFIMHAYADHVFSEDEAKAIILEKAKKGEYPADR